MASSYAARHVTAILLLQWRDSLHRALASLVVSDIPISCCSSHHLMFSSNEESLVMCSRLIRGLPTGRLPWNFPSSTFFGTRLQLDKQNKQQLTADKGFIPD